MYKGKGSGPAGMRMLNMATQVLKYLSRLKDPFVLAVILMNVMIF